MRNSAAPRPPVTALDDLYDEARSVPNYPPEDDDAPPREPQPRRCRDCGSVGGHTSPLCPGNDD